MAHFFLRRKKINIKNLRGKLKLKGPDLGLVSSSM